MLVKNKHTNKQKNFSRNIILQRFCLREVLSPFVTQGVMRQTENHSVQLKGKQLGFKFRLGELEEKLTFFWLIGLSLG